MANEIQIHAGTGQSLYAVDLSTAGQYYNTGTQAYELLTPSNWTNYVLALAEPVAGSGYYFGNIPANFPSASNKATSVLSLLVIYVAAVPGSPASTDQPLIDIHGKTLAYTLDWNAATQTVNSLVSLGKERPQVQLPQQNTAISLNVATGILNQLYAARLQLATTGVVSVTVDGEQTVFTSASQLDQAILFWKREVALLSGRRKRVSTFYMGSRF